MISGNHQLIHQDSGNVEWYTPSHIIYRVHQTFGQQPDLDPASSWIANMAVQAKTYFSLTRYTRQFHPDRAEFLSNRAFTQNWWGKVFMNHPFSRAWNQKWIARLVQQYKDGHIEEAINICFASLATNWFRPLKENAYICFPDKRINYVDIHGNIIKGAPKESVVCYLGPNYDRFIDSFSDIGTILVKPSVLYPRPTAAGKENGHSIVSARTSCSRARRTHLGEF